MTNRDMLDTIAEKFPIIVRNQNHIQIVHANKKFTDIWPMDFGALKVLLYGNHRWNMYYSDQFNDLICKLSKYDYQSNNDLARMRKLETLITKISGKDGIFTDAGWKEGRAKIAIIRIFGSEMDISIREGQYSTSIEAEIIAIRYAHKLYPNATSIYSDCLAAVDDFNKTIEGNIAKWINRKKNKEADKMANLRGNHY